MSEEARDRSRPGEATPPHWIARAEAALDGAPDPDIDVIDGGPPPLLDATGRRTLLAPLLAAFLWSAATFMEQLRGPLDPLVLLLRLLALSVSLRVVWLGARWLARVRIHFQHRRFQLAIAEEGLLVRTPVSDTVIEREQVVEVCAQTTAIGGRERGAWTDVYIVTKPQSGRTHVVLPPVFARESALLVAQLSAWRGEVAAAPQSDAPSTTDIAPKRRLFQRGPLATVLLGVVLLEGYMRLPQLEQSQSWRWVSLVATTCLLLIPGLWAFTARMRRGSKPQALLSISAARLMVALRRVPQLVPWSQATRIEVQLRTAWSLVQGAHEQRALIIGTFDASVLRLGEDEMTVPADVVRALCNAYRHGHVR